MCYGPKARSSFENWEFFQNYHGECSHLKILDLIKHCFPFSYFEKVSTEKYGAVDLFTFFVTTDVKYLCGVNVFTNKLICCILCSFTEYMEGVRVRCKISLVKDEIDFYFCVTIIDFAHANVCVCSQFKNYFINQNNNFKNSTNFWRKK